MLHESTGWLDGAKRQGPGCIRRVCVGRLCVPPMEIGARCLAGDVAGKKLSDPGSQPDSFWRD